MIQEKRGNRNLILIGNNKNSFIEVQSLLARLLRITRNTLFEHDNNAEYVHFSP